MIAIKIQMKNGCEYSNALLEIDQIYINGMGWYKKETLYDYVKSTPNSILVKNIYGSYVVPGISSKGEKYVKSSPNNTKLDNLLRLPRE